MRDIQIISAPSILGLKPTGVEYLAEALLSGGLAEKLGCSRAAIEVETHNDTYSRSRPGDSHVLNDQELKAFSERLAEQVFKAVSTRKFPIVLGGDCSILIGTMSALKRHANHGLIFVDAHADFYLPTQSTTGEAADMDLAIVTGHGPDLLTNLRNLKPYVREDNVFQIGQRDTAEAATYGSQRIQDSGIHCFELTAIQRIGIEAATEKIIKMARAKKVEGYWIHFDTDAISDEENPCVDYRLPGGLTFDETGYLLHKIATDLPVTGITVTIFNPSMDEDKIVLQRLLQCLARVFN